jgi:hypothetical protein
MFQFKSVAKSIFPTPSVGYWYKDADTGKEFKASTHKTFESLEYHVSQYRKQNGLPPIENFRECWEHFICVNSPQDKKICCPKEENIARSFKQYVVGGLTYIKSIFQKEQDKFVTQEEAEKRADKCLHCVMNRKNYGHSFAQFYTDKMMAKSVGNRKVKNWNELYTCMGCSCILNSKVWFASNIVGGSLLKGDIVKLRGAKDSSGKPIYCWQLEARDNLNKQGEKVDGKE